MTTAIFNPIEILTHLIWEECDDLEFKSAKGGLPKSLWETYCAMANAQGGVILLGVENDGTVQGLPNIEKIKKDFWNTIHNRGKVGVNLLNYNDVQDVKIGNKTILAIRVPRATRHHRPVFIGQNPLTGTYRRNLDGDYRCTEIEVSRMLADRSEESADSRILENCTVQELDPKTIRQFRNRFGSFRPSHPWLDEDDQGLLAKLGAWRRCHSSNREGVTVAGLLMFGQYLSLRDRLPQYHVDYREKLSDDPDIRWTDRLMIDGTWEGNLFQFYSRVVNMLSADIKLPFQLDSQLYRKGESIVHVAVREALVNTLIHADYRGQGGIVIEKHLDRFVFSNPGSLLISMEQLFHSNTSECRNKLLQTMFTLIGGAEKAGSGVDKIRAGWNSQHWRTPTVEETVQPDRVQWTLPMVSLIPESSLQRLNQQFGVELGTFSQLEVQALVTADIEGHVSNARMRQVSDAHATDITKILQALVSKGALTQEGQGRWTRYQLHYPHIDSNSLHKESHYPHIDSNSLHKESHYPHIDSTLWDQLLRIAQEAKQNKRLPPKKMELLITKLCRECWLTRKQLSILLDRNVENLRARFLVPMVSHGMLQMRYPDKPTRVDQAYKTVNKKVLVEEEA